MMICGPDCQAETDYATGVTECFRPGCEDVIHREPRTAMKRPVPRAPEVIELHTADGRTVTVLK
jgi:hypothetical protein